MGSNELNILEILLHSGPVVKLVLLVLIFASVASWAIIFKKRKLFKEVSECNDEFLEIYKSSQNLKDVKTKSDMLPFSPYKIIFNNGYDELMKVKALFDGKSGKLSSHFQVFGVGILERGLKQGINVSNNEFDKLLPTLASIGSITPFIGLFGTVWGIINSFKGLAGGGGTLDAVAPGIAEALVATAVGLAAAIPAVWFYNYYSNLIARENLEMENFGQDFLNLIERKLIETE